MKTQKTIYIDTNKLEELKKEAKEMDIPLNSLLKIKLFSKKSEARGDASRVNE